MMAQDSSRPEFDLKYSLDSLRASCGDSEFGYRMQAMFAHLMLRRGAKILEVNTQGHPDIRASIGDVDYLIQVKTSIHSSSATLFELTLDDLNGIRPTGRNQGLLAFLDSAQPVSWIIVRFERVKALLGRSVHVSSLRADSDQILSECYSDEFFEVLDGVGDRLINLTYPLLRRRAMEGKPI